MATFNNNGPLSNLVNGAQPCEGPKCANFDLDFSTAAEFDFNLTQQYQNGEFSTLQSCYIDNSLNPDNVVLQMQGGSGQRIVVGPNQCAYLPLMMTQPPLFIMTSAGTVVVKLILMNFYLPPQVWTVGLV